MSEPSDHINHGAADPYGGPVDPDCPCRGGTEQAECAETGCGFCLAAEAKKP